MSIICNEASCIPVRYLLDTHCLLWFQGNDTKMSANVMKKIQDPKNIILFSQVSLFEIAIKQKIGKLPDFTSTIEEVYLQALNDNFTFLPVSNQHIFILRNGQNSEFLN
jgi:PIN domain nuclease of toxin-antitoxin system